MRSRTYSVRLMLWFTAYAALLASSLALLQGPVLVPFWRAIVGLLPMIAGFGILLTVMQRFRSMDELQRGIMLEALAFAVGTTAIITFSYGFLENSSVAPSLSYFWVWPIMGATWGVGAFLAQRRYR